MDTAELTDDRQGDSGDLEKSKWLCRFEVSISVSSIEQCADSQQSVSEAGH